MGAFTFDGLREAGEWLLRRRAWSGRALVDWSWLVVEVVGRAVELEADALVVRPIVTIDSFPADPRLPRFVIIPEAPLPPPLTTPFIAPDDWKTFDD